jgi:hypothetical protein
MQNYSPFVHISEYVFRASYLIPSLSTWLNLSSWGCCHCSNLRAESLQVAKLQDAIIVVIQVKSVDFELERAVCKASLHLRQARRSASWEVDCAADKSARLKPISPKSEMSNTTKGIQISILWTKYVKMVCRLSADHSRGPCRAWAACGEPSGPCPRPFHPHHHLRQGLART